MRTLFIRSALFIAIGASNAVLAQTADAPANNEELIKRLRELEEKVKALEQGKNPAPLPDAGPRQNYEDLEQKVKILERKRELEEEAALARSKETPIVRAGRDGFGLRSADSNFELRLRGYMQVDARFFEGDGAPTNDTLLIRRARPILEATVFKQFGFRLMPDFGGGTTTLFDAHVDGNFAPAFKVRAGKFKPPFGLERLQSATDLLFVERAFPTNLAPNRDIGVQISGDLFDTTVNYAAGIFNGVVDGGNADADANTSKDFVGRLFAEPFKNTDVFSLQGLGIGIAVSYGRQSGSGANASLPRYVSPAQQTFFNYVASAAASGSNPAVIGAVADGTRIRIGPQLYYANGPFGLLAEYTRSTQEVRRGTERKDISNQAWQFAVSWVLTGENASFRGINPRNPFQWGQGAWGAIEVAARVSRFDVDDAAFEGSATTRFADPRVSARQALDYGLSLNWYMTRFSKFVLSFNHTKFKDGAANGDRRDENVLFNRYQVSF